MKAVAETLGVARSNLIERLQGRSNLFLYEALSERETNLVEKERIAIAIRHLGQFLPFCAIKLRKQPSGDEQGRAAVQLFTAESDVVRLAKLHCRSEW